MHCWLDDKISGLQQKFCKQRNPKEKSDLRGGTQPELPWIQKMGQKNEFFKFTKK